MAPKGVFFNGKMSQLAAEPIETQEAKKGGATPNKGTLQSYIQNFTKESIDAIVDIMRTSRNESLKLGAAKAILDKSIPDVKAIEVGGRDGQPIQIKVINYGGNDTIQLPTDQLYAPSVTVTGAVSSVELAQESKEDDTSDQSINKMG